MVFKEFLLCYLEKNFKIFVGKYIRFLNFFMILVDSIVVCDLFFYLFWCCWCVSGGYKRSNYSFV